jgi:hypothetical protein
VLELEQRVHANEYDVDAWTDLLRAASGHEAVYKTYESFLLVFPTAVGFPGLNGAERQREACVCVFESPNCWQRLAGARGVAVMWPLVRNVSRGSECVASVTWLCRCRALTL